MVIPSFRRLSIGAPAGKAIAIGNFSNLIADGTLCSSSDPNLYSGFMGILFHQPCWAVYLFHHALLLMKKYLLKRKAWKFSLFCSYDGIKLLVAHNGLKTNILDNFVIPSCASALCPFLKKACKVL